LIPRLIKKSDLIGGLLTNLQFTIFNLQ